MTTLCPDAATLGCSLCTADQWNQLISLGWTAAQGEFMCSDIMNGTATMAATYTDEATAGIQGITDGLNTLYLVLCAALVFIMHAGFAMLCAGAIRSKNTMNILLQTILDAAVSGIAFYVVGYGIGYGGYPPDGETDYKSPPNGFIGTALFGLHNYATENPSNIGVGTTGAAVHWQDFVFQWAFAATATTIPAGCVAERFNFNAYLGYSFFISAWVYPIIVHWVWSQYGWLGYGRWQLGHLFRAGMIDFAGSGVVHMVGGFCGMWGCILVGPRMGRFDSNGNPVDMPGHSATLVVLGTVLLWFGWYGFNPGSVLIISTSTGATIVGRAAVTTTLSGAAGGVTALVSSFVRHKAWDLVAVCNGVLCGFVAVTANAHVVEPWAAIIGGAISAVIFDGACALFLKLKIDDPLSAAPMHGVVGAWAVIWTGLLAKQEYVYQYYGGSHMQSDGNDDLDNYPFGLFYPNGGGRLLASQVIGVLVIFGWVAVNMIPFFYVFKMFGMLRISAEEEQAGLDVSKHGGSAYNIEHGEKKGDTNAGAL